MENKRIINLKSFDNIQLNVYETEEENNIFLLFLGGMQTGIPSKICDPIPNFGNGKFRFYAKYDFLFNKGYNNPEYLMPNYIIKEIRILIEMIFLQYPKVKLCIYTQSFSSEPLIRYINEYGDTRINCIFLTGPIILDIKEHIKFRIHSGRIFNFLNDNNNIVFKNNIFNAWNKINNIDNYIIKSSIESKIILGDGEIEKFKKNALLLAKINDIVVIYIKNSGHLPWLPTDYSRKNVKDIEAWKDNANQTQNDFWKIIENSILNDITEGQQKDK